MVYIAEIKYNFKNVVSVARSLFLQRIIIYATISGFYSGANEQFGVLPTQEHEIVLWVDTKNIPWDGPKCHQGLKSLGLNTSLCS